MSDCIVFTHFLCSFSIFCQRQTTEFPFKGLIKYYCIVTATGSGDSSVAERLTLDQRVRVRVPAGAVG